MTSAEGMGRCLVEQVTFRCAVKGVKLAALAFALACALTVTCTSAGAGTIDRVHGRWSALGPPRGIHQVFVDGAHARLVGLSDESTEPLVWTASLEGAHWRVMETTGAPPPRGERAVLDSAGARLIVVAADQGDLRAWTLDLDAEAWQAVPGQGPAASGFQLAWDPARHRALLRAGAPNGIWFVQPDGMPWSFVPTMGGPGERAGAGVVVDSRHDRLIIHGGWLAGTIPQYFNDTWSLDLGTNTWSLLDLPQTLSWSVDQLAVDPVHDRVLAVGIPFPTSTDALHVWALDPADSVWREVSTAGSPPQTGRSLGLAPDPPHQRILVYGTSGARLDELLAEPSLEWRALAEPTDGPSFRTQPTAAYDDGRRLMWTMLGTSIEPVVWRLHLDGVPTWEALPSTNAPDIHSAGSIVVLDPVGTLALFGGDPSNPDYNLHRGVVEESVSWMRVAPMPATYVPRVGPGAAAIGGSGTAFVFGGAGNVFHLGQIQFHFLNDLWTLESNGDFREVLPRGGVVPLPRWNHSLVEDPIGHRIIVFGGDSLLGATPIVHRDVRAYSPADSEWTLLSADGPPRTRHAAVYDPIRNRMIVIGGSNGTDRTSEVWALSLGTSPQWTTLQPAGTGPLPISDAAGIYDPVRDRVILFGGSTDPGASRSTWALGFGETAIPVVTCQDPEAALAGDVATIRTSVTSRLDVPAVHLGSLRVGNFTYVVAPFIGAHEAVGQDWQVTVPDGASGAIDAVFRGTVPGITAASDPCTCTVRIRPVVTDAVVQIESGSVIVTWSLGDTIALRAEVERRLDAGAWTIAGDPTVLPGQLRYVDDAPEPGAHYDYRLRIQGGHGPLYFGTIGTDIPFWRLALRGFVPNPSEDAGGILFTLPDGEPAALDVFDLAGRCVYHAEVGALGRGSHRLPMPDAIRAGVYFVRLRHVQGTKVVRGVVLR